MVNENSPVNFSHHPCTYWKNRLKISYLQRRILVHSILYYEMNTSVISDQLYDDLGKQLIWYKRRSPNEFALSSYYEIFEDYEGSTGYYLIGRLNEKEKEYLTKIANAVLKQNGKG